MFEWRVIALSGLAVALLAGGLAALILPGPLEGAVLYGFNEQHAITTLDGLGLLLLALGSVIALGAGLLWQRRMHGSE